MDVLNLGEQNRNVSVREIKIEHKMCACQGKNLEGRGSERAWIDVFGGDKSDVFHWTLHRLLLSPHPQIMASNVHTIFHGRKFSSAQILFTGASQCPSTLPVFDHRHDVMLHNTTHRPLMIVVSDQRRESTGGSLWSKNENISNNGNSSSST